MSESETDNLGRERTEALRGAINDASDDETTEVSRSEWLNRLEERRDNGRDASNAKKSPRDTRPPEADQSNSDVGPYVSNGQRSAPGSGTISLPPPPSRRNKRTSGHLEDERVTSEFYQSPHRAAPAVTVVELASQRLSEYLPRGAYRVLSGLTIYDGVTPIELARLICRGALVGVDKIMLDNGPWHPASEHPALRTIRELFAGDINAVLE